MYGSSSVPAPGYRWLRILSKGVTYGRQMNFFSVYDSTGLSSVGPALECCMIGDSCNVGAAEAVVDWDVSAILRSKHVGAGRRPSKLTVPVDMCGGGCVENDEGGERQTLKNRPARPYGLIYKCSTERAMEIGLGDRLKI